MIHAEWSSGHGAAFAQKWASHDAASALLQLEAALRPETLSLPFLAFRQSWLAAVAKGEWTILDACATVLHQAVHAAYAPAPPRFGSVPDPTDELHRAIIPRWAPFSAEVHEAGRMQRSTDLRAAALADIAANCSDGESDTYGAIAPSETQALLQLLEALLPREGVLELACGVWDGKTLSNVTLKGGSVPYFAGIALDWL
jgi:hypothetical protein